MWVNFFTPEFYIRGFNTFLNPFNWTSSRNLFCMSPPVCFVLYMVVANFIDVCWHLFKHSFRKVHGSFQTFDFVFWGGFLAILHWIFFF